MLKSYILFPNQLENLKKLVSEFNLLTHKKYKNPAEIFLHSFCKDFQDDFLNAKNLNYKKANNTSTAKVYEGVLEEHRKLNLDFYKYLTDKYPLV